jgi:methylated-DNA-[protein]-cysteine S-methyltransferase
MIFYTTMDSSIGRLVIASTNRGLIRIMLPRENNSDSLARLQEAYPGQSIIEDSDKNRDAVKQLREYFEGTRTVFSLPLELRGTEFQKSVWRTVARVPYGQTKSYGDIAREIRKPKACRAVGAANGANPIPIVIPCHRIIGSDGSMTGFGGGIPLKEKLLRMEKNT